MTSLTPRLNLVKPSTADAFSTADIAANWQKIDDSPGIFLCTSATRPTWGTSQKGREILETDTMLKWIWTGSTAAGGFIRSAPTGLLKRTDGSWAYANRTSNYATASNSYSVALTLDNVVVPAGNRTLMIVCTYPQVTNPTSGITALGIYRTATPGGTPKIGSWWVTGDSQASVAGAQGSGGSFVTYEKGGLPAGTYTYTLQIARGGAAASTSTLRCDTTTPVELTVVEI